MINNLDEVNIERVKSVKYRQQKVISLLNEKGKVTEEELVNLYTKSDGFNVNFQTYNLDLRQLQKAGIIEKRKEVFYIFKQPLFIPSDSKDEKKPIPVPKIEEKDESVINDEIDKTFMDLIKSNETKDSVEIKDLNNIKLNSLTANDSEIE